MTGDRDVGHQRGDHDEGHRADGRIAVAKAGDGPRLGEPLQGASLSVSDGEILAVMGPSGSGKSTLLHCLAGIFTPDSGEVWFGGQRVDQLTDKKRSQLRRTAFGFVFQFGQSPSAVPWSPGRRRCSPTSRPGRSTR